MEFSFTGPESDVLVLRADAGIDSHNAQAFLNELQRLVEGGARHLVVDCSALGYISSFGITTLIRLHKRMTERDGTVKLAAVKTPLVRLLEITRLHQVFTSYASVEEALAALAAERAGGAR